jgi:tRNA pseudouridine13 synthase
VRSQTWNIGLPGDVFNLNLSNSHFQAEVIDPTLQERLSQGDIHPTGLLWGKGNSGASADTLKCELAVIDEYPILADGLLKASLQQDRRALRVMPENLCWQLEADNCRLSFGLPAGSYATALLREIVNTTTTSIAA